MEIECNHNNFDSHALNLLSCFPLWVRMALTSYYRHLLKEMLLSSSNFSKLWAVLMTSGKFSNRFLPYQLINLLFEEHTHGVFETPVAFMSAQETYHSLP